MQEQSIFSEALEKEDAAERAAFLDHACVGDPALRQRIERLLQRHQEADSFLERPAAATGAFIPNAAEEPVGTDQAENCPGALIGPYKLLQQIGEGGMGTVFMAEQTQPVQRKVALKIIKSGMDSKQVIARFEAERQALALMDHPNIARVLEAGTTDNGRPFFVMELVKGVPITTYCDQRRLTPKQRLELFLPVCQAVQHAHQKGIIHRDLKPSNVLVALYDDQPVPKVIDFGIAKATGQQLTERTLFTEFGQVVGTLEYMSPEQAGLNQLDIDTRSDVYSLGVLLYELLTGSTPLDKKRLREKAMLEVLRLIREEEPPKPSTRLSATAELPSVAANRGLEPKKLSGLVRGELDWVVMKALEKDRNRRYETANGLAQDVQRYLTDETVQACPPSAWYRFRKFARRNRAGLLTTAAILLVGLLVSSGIALALWDRASRSRETDRTVSVALSKAEQWAELAKGRQVTTSQAASTVLGVWGQADAAVVEAEAALRTGVGEEGLRQRLAEVRQRLEQDRRQTDGQLARVLKKEALLRALDDARVHKSTWIGNSFDNAGAAVKYRDAFAAYGLEVNGANTTELAQQIRTQEPIVREALFVALYDWSHCGGTEKSNPSARELWSLLEAADDDGWRKQHRAAEVARDVPKLLALSVAARKLSLSPASLDFLATTLFDAGEQQEAFALSRWARHRHPSDFFIPYNLGTRLRQRLWSPTPVELEEAIGCFRATLAIRPEATAALNELGMALLDKGQLDEAFAAFHKAIALDPKFARALNNLGTILHGKNQIKEAIAAYKKAIQLDPKNAKVYDNLGSAWRDSLQFDQAIAAHQKAIELDPKDALSYTRLGQALQANNRLDDAIVAYKVAIGLDPSNSKIYVNFGLALAQKNQFAAAIAAYQKAIELNPKNALSYYNLGITWYAKEQWSEAITVLRKAIELNPKLAQAHYLLGISLRIQKQFNAARSALQKTIELDPKNAAAYTNLGLVLAYQKEWVAAIAAHRQAIDIDPKFAKAHFNLGFTLQRNQQDEEAIGEYRAAIALDDRFVQAYINLGIVLGKMNQWNQAIAAYEKAGDLDPKNANIHHSLGLVWVVQENWDKAITAFQKAIELDPKLATAYANLGLAWNAKDHWDKAITAFQKAIELDPKTPDYHFHLGAAHDAKKQGDEAIAAYQKVIELNPRFAMAYINLGVNLTKKTQLNDADAAFRKAIALEPKNATAHFNRGVVLSAQKQFDKAIAAYQKTIDLDPKRILAYHNLGITLATLKRLDEAIAAYQKAIGLDPKDASVYASLGIALAAKKQFNEAIAAYQKAIDLNPRYAMAYLSLGISLYARNRVDEAIAAYQKAMECDPDDVRAPYQLGNVLRDLGNLPGAQAAFEKATKLRPDYAQAHCNLGQVLRRLGMFRSALEHLRRGHELGTKNPDWPYNSAGWVNFCERLLKLDEQLADFLAGKATPVDATERLLVAELCSCKRLHRAAARFFEDAFDARPEFLSAQRYPAACAAALAGCGQGEDATKLDDHERTRLRTQALGWLRDELAKQTNQLKTNPDQVKRMLWTWQGDLNLAGVRAPDRLAKLPKAEQEAWRQFWADVAATVQRSQTPPKAKTQQK